MSASHRRTFRAGAVLAASIDRNTIRQPVVGFVPTHVGLQAGVSLQGAKVVEVQS